MSEKIICDKNAEYLAPGFVKHYVRQPTEKIPDIIIINLDSQLSKEEKRLSDFFKCTKNWLQDLPSIETITDLDKCFATRHTPLNFNIHLKEKHSSDELFCVYCYLSNTPKSVLKMYCHRYLIKHMMKKHRFRRFQCNLCLYRGLTENHVIFHQNEEHHKEFVNTLNPNIEQTSNTDICKIFVCPEVLKEDNKSIFYFLRKYKTERFNCEGNNETLYQCLYCQEMNKNLLIIFEHISKRHPDYPLLYYIPDPLITSSTNYQIIDDWDSYNKIAVVRPKRPKIEPQDNSVSSTQKSPESNTCDNSVKRVSEEERTASKRIKHNSNEPNNSNKNNLIQSQSKIICLFCDQTFIESDKESAKRHLETHLEISDCSQSVLNWVQTFLLKQWQLCSFDDVNKENQNKAHYYCPLCLKIAKLHNRVAKYYKTFSEVRNHLWHHCCWLSVKCKLCQSFLSNCDPIIAKHFTDNHQMVTKSKKYSFLGTKDSELVFSDEERNEMEKKSIEVNYNPIIETFINNLLIEIKKDFENQWRVITKCDKLMPTPCLIRLPQSSFDYLYKNYEKYERKKLEKELRKKKRREEKELKKNLKVMEKIDRICELKNTSNESSNDSNTSKYSSGHQKSSENSNNSSKETNNMSNTDKIDKCDQFLQNLGHIKSFIGNSGQQSSSNSLSLSNDTEKEVNTDNREPDSDNSLVEEEILNRITCYHCNGKFKSKGEFKEHSKAKHPNQALRMYSKPRKTNDI